MPWRHADERHAAETRGVSCGTVEPRARTRFSFCCVFGLPGNLKEKRIGARKRTRQGSGDGYESPEGFL